ncbi:hypothetical protein SAMN05428959_1011145 [Duganella sp. CF517]|uniref:hypothetical protein n=1 Tax=Duganella sp. CF517 TaxID=1881038 RepID=UPI0008D30EE2|nr:hypothetical protein [Duganella sp. CF517]SEN31649.1 hypothetical protein SAMN05428959_1011145 [Duganella sp. CF517]
MSVLKSASFNIEISGPGPTIARELVFSSGETISFNIKLPLDREDTITELHRKSAARVIELMQNFLNPPEKK